MPNNMAISNLKKNEESKEYEACTFNLENKSIVFRKAKATPTKLGHFVTIWQRKNGITSPYDEGDRFDYLIISSEDGVNFGQFVFDKQALIKHGIISSKNKKGKRGMRVYAPWIKPNNKTALNTQSWQCKYFIKSSDGFDSALHIPKMIIDRI